MTQELAPVNMDNPGACLVLRVPAWTGSTRIRLAIEYGRLDLQLSYWRAHSGAEVDLLLARGRRIVAALEIKSSARRELAVPSGLRTLLGHSSRVPAFALGTGERESLLGAGIRAVPWQRFIEESLPAL